VTTNIFSCRNHYKINICPISSKRKTFIQSFQFDKFYLKVKGIIIRYCINRIIPALKKKRNSLIKRKRKELYPKLIQFKFVNKGKRRINCGELFRWEEAKNKNK
tara:strand:- start:294 stop:605 length:312 start_codon:yes stop_codon:yes gene_type:complete